MIALAYAPRSDRRPARQDHPLRPSPSTRLIASTCVAAARSFLLTEFWSRLESHLVILLCCEQAVMRAVPAPILRVRMRVVGETANTLVAPDGGEVPSFGVDNIVDFLHGMSDVPSDTSENCEPCRMLA
jgi:hypothetical protein